METKEQDGGKSHMWAISGTSGSSGLGSVNSEQIDSSTCTDEHTVDALTWQQERPQQTDILNEALMCAA